MKVEDLLEAYDPSFRKDNPNSEHGRIRGTISDWLKGMGVTSEDVAKAYTEIKRSPEYKAILALGMKDESTDREKKTGTLNFKGKIKEAYSYSKKIYNNNMQYKVLPHGKIDYSQGPSQFADRPRGDRAVPKPTMVVGDPVKTVVKTMTNALKRLHQLISNRQEKAEKAIKKFEEKESK